MDRTFGKYGWNIRLDTGALLPSPHFMFWLKRTLQFRSIATLVPEDVWIALSGGSQACSTNFADANTKQLESPNLAPDPT
jgi:hypothetical protein